MKQNAQLFVNALCVSRDERVLLDGIHFTCQAGDILQIIGANGCGKTTLLRAILGLFPWHQGEIHWRGQCIRQNPEIFRQETLYIGHQLSSHSDMTCLENLCYGAWLKQPTDHNRARAALAQMGISHLQHRLAGHCSAGQQRRLALARLILQPASCWILDEPLTALDPEGRECVQALIKTHSDQGGITILTTHHLFATANLPITTLELT